MNEKIITDLLNKSQFKAWLEFYPKDDLTMYEFFYYSPCDCPLALYLNSKIDVDYYTHVTNKEVKVMCYEEPSFRISVNIRGTWAGFFVETLDRIKTVKDGRNKGFKDVPTFGQCLYILS